MDSISVRLFVAHPVARAQYGRILAGQEGMRCVETAGFDVGVFDAALPALEGLLTLAWTACPAMRALLVSETEDAGTYARWIMRGIWGAVVYDRYERELPLAVRRVAEGQMWFPASVVTRWMRSQVAVLDVRDPARATLTSREREVIDLLLRRLSNKEIADLLRIRERTVKFHVGNILAKLHVKSRHDVVLAAPPRHVAGFPVPPVP